MTASHHIVARQSEVGYRATCSCGLEGTLVEFEACADDVSPEDRAFDVAIDVLVARHAR